MTLIENCRQWWRMWSLRLNAAGLALLAWVQVDPVGVLSVWNMMPGEARSALPPSFVRWAGLVLIALAMLARLVRQPKLEGGSNGQRQ